LFGRTGSLTGADSLQKKLKDDIAQLTGVEGGATGLSALIHALQEARNKEAAQIQKVAETIRKVGTISEFIERMHDAAQFAERRIARLEQIMHAGGAR
jgi:DNA repair exonuclease SbcCD ATPase subunit